MNKIKNMSRTYFGFKGKSQLPWFMVFTIWHDANGEPYNGRVHFSSMDAEASVKRFWQMAIGAFGFMAGA